MAKAKVRKSKATNPEYVVVEILLLCKDGISYSIETSMLRQDAEDLMGENTDKMRIGCISSNVL